MMNLITSKDNKIIKLAYNLINNKKSRDENQMFVIEGIKTINEIPETWTIKNIIISNDFYKNIELISCIKNKNALESILCVCSESVFKSISTMINPEGVLAIVCKNKYELSEIINDNSIKKVVLLDDIQDPGNLGTIIRSADAMGINAIITSDKSVDLYNPKVTRSTMGSMFHLPIIDKVNIVDALKVLKIAGFKVYSTSLNTTKYMDEINLKDDKICAVIGNEAHGVSEEVINNSDEVFKIEMKGNAESLNASIAASIIMYELAKNN